MPLSPVQKSLRALRFQERRRRALAAVFIGWGIAMIGLNFWIQHQASESISKAIEYFYDTPMVAMPVMSSVTLTMANSRINLLIGIAFVAFGAVRLFVPDFKTIVLLEVADKLGVGQLPGEDQNNGLQERE